MLAGKLAYFAPTLDADAATYIAAVETADGQTLETAVRTAINDFVVGCKDDGIFTALKSCCILMGARTLAGALTPLVGTAPTNNNFVSGDYNRKTGLIGNKSTKYLNTNRAANADGQNDAHFSIYLSAAASSGATRANMAAGTTPDAFLRDDTNPNFRSRGVNSGNLSSSNLQTATGFVGVSRTSSTAWTYRFSGTTSTGPTTASSSNTANWYIYARSNTTPDLYSDCRAAFYSLGSSLTLSLLDSRVATLYTAIGAAIP